jgi:hypothetical protein
MDTPQIENPHDEIDDVIKVYWLCGITFEKLYTAINEIWNSYPETSTFTIMSGEPLMRGPHIEVNFSKKTIHVCVYT